MLPENQRQLAKQLIDKARAMLPTLKARAKEAEAQGQVHKETVKEMNEAGFFRVLQPKRYGGYELDPQVFFEIQMTLAQGDMSVAWIYGVIAVHNWQLALFDDQAAKDVWGENGEKSDVLIASTYMPVGKVEHVDGGYKFSGHWSFSSGSEHADWVFLGTMVPPKPGETPQGPDMRTFLVPKKDFKIVQNWDVMGLKATGSNDIVVENAFVPEYRTHKGTDAFACQSPGNAVNTAELFKIPFGQIFPRAVSTSSIGALQGAIHVYIDKMAKRVGVNDGKKGSQDPESQTVLAKAQITHDELKASLIADYDYLMAAARGEVELTLEDRIRMRYNAGSVVQKCADAVDGLFRMAGGSSIFYNHPLIKYWLDIHSGRAHVANRPGPHSRNYGGVRLGEANGDFFL